MTEIPTPYDPRAKEWTDHGYAIPYNIRQQQEAYRRGLDAQPTCNCPGESDDVGIRPKCPVHQPESDDRALSDEEIRQATKTTPSWKPNMVIYSTAQLRAADTARRIESKIVAWCRDCLYHITEEEIGGRCLMDCERTLIKRRLWICSECECSYRLKSKAEDHICHECY